METKYFKNNERNPKKCVCVCVDIYVIRFWFQHKLNVGCIVFGFRMLNLPGNQAFIASKPF